ncbi:hypothetical protein H5410_027231 [Solanum commersonii]|uniref:Putative plant transposon protein domain-containing protein n=1 Tax=Solanum commersonii TaxID=4109 RepID=A0A9J5YYH7_SOLCO|nr:hypothetical protein H5410_027231 [Solanum commersonii]
MVDRYVNEVRLQSQFPMIYTTVNNLGLRFIFGLSHLRPLKSNKSVLVRGRDVKFTARILNEFLGTPNCDNDDFNRLKDKPPYRDIRHTLCGVESTASVLLPAKHVTEVMRDRVVLVYMLMKGLSINVGAILRQNMMKFRKEVLDLTVAFHLDLIGKIVDVTRTKALDTSHGLVLSAQERQARDNSVMDMMFGMAELQLQIGGRPSATFLCRTGPAFLEPLDNDEAVDEEMYEEDGDVDDEVNALMA